jgi:UDP-galactopyranose mutase
MSIQKNSFIGTMEGDKKRNRSKETEQCNELSGLIRTQTRIHMGGQSGTEESPRSAVHTPEEPALLVFSHLRWHFVTQRPQHLLTRAAQSRHVYFWEEPWFHDATDPESQRRDGGSLEFLQAEQTENVTIIRPNFNHGEDSIEGQRRLLDRFLLDRRLERFDSWFYTSMALSFTAHLHPCVTVYDCMDELSAFLGAPPELIEREKELFRVADVIFTGGQSIYEAKRSKHSNVHAFPSSIDVPHFAQARTVQSTPSDQAGIPHPRVGFFGVLDERFDSALVSEVARLRPHVHFVLLGPVVKVDPAQLPAASNIHYLGSKSYAELPRYLAGWDAAIMPFAMNDFTRFISPTKTPEYLAAGKRVVSTPIKDVVADYGMPGLIEIAGTASEFATALDRAISADHDAEWSQRVERKLAQSSWDLTWAAMRAEIDAVRNRKSKDVPPISRLRSSHKFSSASGEPFDYLVVGAGFAGSVVAERLASQLGKRV